MKSSVLVNCPWGSACSCWVTTVHFLPTIAGPVLSLHIRAPLPVPRGPPAKGPVCNKENCQPGEPPWGLARSSCEAPVHFRPHFTARFWVLSMCTRWAQGCCCRWWRGRPSWWTIQTQHAVILLPDPRHAARGHYISAHAQINMPGSPHGRQNEVIAGLLTWHPSASTADSLLICRIVYKINSQTFLEFSAWQFAHISLLVAWWWTTVTQTLYNIEIPTVSLCFTDLCINKLLRLSCP
jgi:hypothetical protein